MSTTITKKLFLRLATMLLLLGPLSLSFAQTQQKRPITDKDIFQFQWIGDPQVSPDGASIVFVRVSVDDKKTGYNTSLWMTPASGGAPIRMTNGKHDTQPRWSPDGKWIAFVRGGEMKDGKPQPGQIALLSLSGGEAATITSVPHGSSHPVWSPDGKRIAFLSDANAEDIEKAKEKHPAEPEHESDVRIITRAVYRMNGAGYLDPKHHQHIWIEEVPASGDTQMKP
ncbi:MAG: S9 family peptidase, partial [Acidobacteriaceae bacterium]